MRLQPKLGTVEVRIMDAQSRVADVAALAAIVQCLVRRHADLRDPPAIDPDVLAENRFLAARDGVRAQLIDPASARRPARDALAELLEACRPYAAALGCMPELVAATALAADPGDRASDGWRYATGSPPCRPGSPANTLPRATPLAHRDSGRAVWL